VIQEAGDPSSFTRFTEHGTPVLYAQLGGGASLPAPLWIVHFHEGRAEIRGSAHMAGRHGADLPPIIEACARH
jgi:hypothetical protein